MFHCRNKLKSIPVLVHRQHAPLFAQPKTDQITFRQAITMEIRCDRFMGENLHRCISKHTTGMDVCILGKPISCLNPIRVFLFLRSLTWLEVQVQCLPIGRAIRPWIAVRRRMPSVRNRDKCRRWASRVRRRSCLGRFQRCADRRPHSRPSR